MADGDAREELRACKEKVASLVRHVKVCQDELDGCQQAMVRRAFWTDSLIEQLVAELEGSWQQCQRALKCAAGIAAETKYLKDTIKSRSGSNSAVVEELRRRWETSETRANSLEAELANCQKALLEVVEVQRRDADTARLKRTAGTGESFSPRRAASPVQVEKLDRNRFPSVIAGLKQELDQSRAEQWRWMGRALDAEGRASPRPMERPKLSPYGHTNRLKLSEQPQEVVLPREEAELNSDIVLRHVTPSQAARRGFCCESPPLSRCPGGPLSRARCEGESSPRRLGGSSLRSPKTSRSPATNRRRSPREASVGLDSDSDLAPDDEMGTEVTPVPANAASPYGAASSFVKWVSMPWSVTQ